MVSVIKNKDLFVSLQTGTAISGEHSTFANPVPRQVPHGTKLEEVENQAEFSSATLQILMVIQLALQIVLKGALNDLWGLFFTLQIMCYLNIYDTPIPSSAGIFLDQFKNIIKFKLLKPDGMIQMFYPDFSIKEKILGTKVPINKDQEFNIFVDLEVYIFIFIGVVVALIVLGILYLLLERLRTKILKLIIEKKNSFVYNGFLRS